VTGSPGRSASRRPRSAGSDDAWTQPIEQAFARKALLRSAAARTVETLWHAIGQLLDAFSPTEGAHDLTHPGYVPANRATLQADDACTIVPALQWHAMFRPIGKRSKRMTPG
jgi:hypothetical protein